MTWTKFFSYTKKFLVKKNFSAAENIFFTTRRKIFLKNYFLLTEKNKFLKNCVEFLLLVQKNIFFDSSRKIFLCWIIFSLHKNFIAQEKFVVPEKIFAASKYFLRMTEEKVLLHRRKNFLGRKFIKNIFQARVSQKFIFKMGDLEKKFLQRFVV